MRLGGNNNYDMTLTTIQSSRFGKLEIETDKVITLTSPFLGFADAWRFVLIPHGPKSVFWWLQATDYPELAFVVIQPALIVPEYRPEIPRQLRRELQAEDEELEVLIMLNIPQGRPEAMTANLLGPVVLNPAKKLARQVLLDPARYDPCWPVLKG